MDIFAIIFAIIMVAAATAATIFVGLFSGSILGGIAFGIFLWGLYRLFSYQAGCETSLKSDELNAFQKSLSDH